MTVKECYDILELPKGATLDDVKAAYRRLAFALHPDLNPAPDAARRFQAVNEAYVLLRQALEKEGPQRQNERPNASKAAGTSTQKAADKGSRADGKSAESGSFFFSRFRAETASGQTASSGKQDGAASSARFRQADNAYARQEEVLQDILRDPFARRVFEDIYSEIRKTGSSEKPSSSSQSTAEKRLTFELSGKKLAMDVRKPGVVSKVGGWLRRQIDDEQTVYVSPSGLHPGARILLKIQQGMSEEVRTVEIVLPSDFVSGKPLRLKGLGRKIGPWQGDLYLKVVPKN